MLCLRQSELNIYSCTEKSRTKCVPRPWGGWCSELPREVGGRERRGPVNADRAGLGPADRVYSAAQSRPTLVTHGLQTARPVHESSPGSGYREAAIFLSGFSDPINLSFLLCLYSRQILYHCKTAREALLKKQTGIHVKKYRGKHHIRFLHILKVEDAMRAAGWDRC